MDASRYCSQKSLPNNRSQEKLYSWPIFREDGWMDGWLTSHTYVGNMALQNTSLVWAPCMDLMLPAETDIK